MKLLDCLFRKKSKPNIPPIPPLETIISMMYEEPVFICGSVNFIYSKDKTMRYVIFRNDKGIFSYILEEIYVFDEDEWKYICIRDNALPATWQPFTGRNGNSFFENYDDLLKELKAEPEYKLYFE